MQAIQADVILRDAEVFTPYVIAAFERARSDPKAAPQLRALAADADVAEAVGRLRRWDGSTPTGIAEGYDEKDKPGDLDEPSRREIQASIAASIYSLWRSRMIANVIDATLGVLPRPDDQDSLAALRNLLDNFATNNGRGASGVDFFVVSGVPAAADRRDIVILRSLRAALDLAAGPQLFASANQNDYRWGRLHRIVFQHPLGGPFNIPAGGGSIATDGGFQTVDASSHSARATTAAGFMFRDGPNHRTVVETRADAMHAESVWPGGTSGVLGSPNYAQFLERWLANEALKLRLEREEVNAAAALVRVFVPQD
jgi:penicillin amidase